MVRLEKQGDSFVMITGGSQKQNLPQQSINDLITGIIELQKNPPDKTKIQDGILYLDNSAGVDLRREIKNILQKAMDNKGMTVTDL
jgi:hypothetical protein